MNKLMGFYEINRIGVPAVPWETFNDSTKLDDNLLWTVRSAVYTGDDTSLPRAVGVTSEEAYAFYKKTRHTLGENGIVIYYPYFIAEKSGTIQVFDGGWVIEAVKADLWNLVTENKVDATYRSVDEVISKSGNPDFLTVNELEELQKCIAKVRGKYYREILSGSVYQLEWSFAVNTNKNRKKVGNQYLIFYECRTV